MQSIYIIYSYEYLYIMRYIVVFCCVLACLVVVRVFNKYIQSVHQSISKIDEKRWEGHPPPFLPDFVTEIDKTVWSDDLKKKMAATSGILVGNGKALSGWPQNGHRVLKIDQASHFPEMCGSGGGGAPLCSRNCGLLLRQCVVAALLSLFSANDHSRSWSC